MKDKCETKAQLLQELARMRQRVAELKISGADRKRSEKALENTGEYAEDIIATVREPLVVLDAELKVVTANRSFYRTFQVEPAETEGRLVYDLGNRQWDIPRLRELLEKVLPTNTAFDDYAVKHDFETIGLRTMLLNARRIYREANKSDTILLAIEDITERKRAEEELRKHRQHLEELVKQRTAEIRKANEELNQDITERKRGEEELEALLRLHEATVQGIASSLLVMDRDLNILMANRRYLETAGIEAS